MIRSNYHKTCMVALSTLLIGCLLLKACREDDPPVTDDILESSEIGITGGSIMAEDPITGIFVTLNFPEGALPEPTLMTLVIHGAGQPGVLDKTHIKGISILPEGLYLQETGQLNVYNPPVDVTEAMILYQVVNSQFIIPLGSQVQHEDEGWVEGSFYITGKFSLGTPAADEVADQCNELAAYDPASPLAQAFERPDSVITLKTRLAETDDECLRWQKVLTKVGAMLTWAQQHQLLGNTSSANAEIENARKALQDAINEYLDKPSPANKCGNYIRAAAKYLESAMLLGLDVDDSPLYHHFEQLIDACSFVFNIETREWIDHPWEEHDDGSTTMEKLNCYAIINCHIPWNKFLVTGDMEVRGEGNMSLHYENHWIGGDENTHEETNTTWRVTEIEGGVSMNYDEFGVAHPVANITIYWEGEAITRLWGKRHGNPPYDQTNTADRSFIDYKTFPVENGYSEKFGDSKVGSSLTVYVLKKPGDESGDPNSCF